MSWLASIHFLCSQYCRHTANCWSLAHIFLLSMQITTLQLMYPFVRVKSQPINWIIAFLSYLHSSSENKLFSLTKHECFPHFLSNTSTLWLTISAEDPAHFLYTDFYCFCNDDFFTLYINFRVLCIIATCLKIKETFSYITKKWLLIV